MISRSWAVGLIAGLLLVAVPRVRADVYRVGDQFGGFKGVDQHGKEFVFEPGSWRFIIFETPGESGEAAPPKDPEWFDKNRAVMMVNISEFSSFKKRIARGRLESKPFRLIVIDDKDLAGRFPRQQGKFTVLQLDDKGVITAISHPAPGKELQALIAPETK
ncbi:MAG TPA: hypothetical protein PLX89_05635 [Verrucomicrobiota bacterium]|nr:hypothetical protein [Verrucomicrobiales bacterium]HRI12469.1 hypothetical protein [Verrucomicrobiota bacterium]